MQFTINREILLKPLQLVTAVIERRQTLPILSNLLIQLRDKALSLLGTDMEVELTGRVTLEKSGESGITTAPARKLMDIYIFNVVVAGLIYRLYRRQIFRLVKH